LRAVPSLLACLVGAGALALALRLLHPLALQPLDVLQRAIVRPALLALALGVVALVMGIVGLVLLRRSHLHRAALLAVAAGVGITTGSAALVVGGFHATFAARGFGWDHVSVPAVPESVSDSPVLRGLVASSVVIVAPGADGDARDLAIGAGVIVRSDGRTAHALTCSHVAMPHVAVAARRDAATAPAVLVYFSDGRCVTGHVAWVGPPLLDVAVIETLLPNAPGAVTIATDTRAVGQGDSVWFVPNPLRHGWMPERGNVLRRDSLSTPDGVFSLLHTSLPVQPGDSGSGLFDTSGRLLGLNTWLRLGEDGHEGISLPSEVVSDMMGVIEARIRGPAQGAIP
jgi:S1-C subfamily serine protease